MPTVAQLPAGVRICQYHRDHNPPHFHAVQGDDEALITIALPFTIIAGRLRPSVVRDVERWAGPRRPLLALNWIDALANQPIQRIV